MALSIRLGEHGINIIKVGYLLFVNTLQDGSPLLHRRVYLSPLILGKAALGSELVLQQVGVHMSLEVKGIGYRVPDKALNKLKAIGNRIVVDYLVNTGYPPAGTPVWQTDLLADDHHIEVINV